MKKFDIGMSISDYSKLIQRAEAAEARAAQLEAERDELARKLEQAQASLLMIHEQAYRASLVQDRSVGIIKQVCASISVDAKDSAVKLATP